VGELPKYYQVQPLAMLAVNVRPRPTDPELALAAVMRVSATATTTSTATTKTSAAAPHSVPPLTPAMGQSRTPCVSQKPKGVSFTEWICEGLGRSRGVIAAFPRALWPVAAPGTTTPDPYAATSSRIVMLDQKRAVGNNWWWLWALKGTKYDTGRHYAMDDSAAVYRTDGLEGNEWFPEAMAYDPMCDPDHFERASLAGFAVCVRHVPPLPTGGAPATLSEIPGLGQRVLFELEAAACGSGPAVFGTMLVDNAGAFGMHKVNATQLATAESTIGVDTNMEISSRIVACVSVTQTHSYRLSDMLSAHNSVMADPLLRPRVSVGAIDATVYESTLSIARKIRYLAQARILKLNVTPDTVVFCPRLVEGDTGDLEATGFGYFDPDRGDAVKGVPFLWDFDPIFTKRVASTNKDYDTDSAYAIMTLVLLSSVRAQFGEVYRIMLHRLTGRSPEGKPLAEQELPDDYVQRISLSDALKRVRIGKRVVPFSPLLRSVFPTFGKGGEETSLTHTSCVSLMHDFSDIVRSAVLEDSTSPPSDTQKEVGFEPTRPVFEKLIRRLCSSVHVDTALFSLNRTPPDALASREEARREERRLTAVRVERLKRLAERAEIPLAV